LPGTSSVLRALRRADVLAAPPLRRCWLRFTTTSAPGCESGFRSSRRAFRRVHAMMLV
jgi:hypothetical protein